MNICYIKKTGQSVSGELKYEGIWYGGGWRIDDKGKSIGNMVNTCIYQYLNAVIRQNSLLDTQKSL